MAQQAMLEQYNRIRGDSMYGKLKDTWEKHVQSPDVDYAIRQGWKTAEQSYQEVKEAYYKEALKRAADTVEKLQSLGATPVEKKPPHMESGKTQTVPMPTEEMEKTERKQKLKQAPSTDDNLEALIREILPDADPIIRT